MRTSSAFLAAQAFMAGKPFRGASACYSTGSALWSYGTIIAERQQSGAVVYNNTSYSNTTTRHQSAFRLAAGLAGIEYITVSGIPMGAERLIPRAA